MKIKIMMLGLCFALTTTSLASTNQVFAEHYATVTQPVEPYVKVLPDTPVNDPYGTYTSNEFSLTNNQHYTELDYYFDNQSQSTATVTLKENRNNNGYNKVSSFTVEPGQHYTGVYQLPLTLSYYYDLSAWQNYNSAYQLPKTRTVSYVISISTQYSYPVVGTVSASYY